MVPAANPDGSHLVTDYFNETAGTDFTRTYPDLYHPYTGHDDNRDWLFFTQKESQTRIGVFKKYRPVVEHILHQAGSSNPRMWVPPWDDGISDARSALRSGLELARHGHRARALFRGQEGRLLRQRLRDLGHVGHRQLRDLHGLGARAVRDREPEGSRLPVHRSDGKPLGNQDRSMRNLLPYDKSTWTLEQDVDYLESGVWLGLESVAREPARWALDELYKVPRNAVNSNIGPFAYVLPAGQRDMYAVYDQLKVLQDGTAEIDRATAPFTAGGKNYPAGSYVIKTRQPMGTWVNQVLGNRPYPNARNCASCPLLMPYSEATDNEPTMLGITADPVASSFTASLERVTDVAPQTVLMPQPPAANGAYLVEPSSEGVSYFLSNLQSRACRRSARPRRSRPAGTTSRPARWSSRRRRRRARCSDTSKTPGLQVYATDAAPKVAGFESSRAPALA